MKKIALIAFTLILVLGLTVSLVWAGSSVLHAIPWQVLAGGGQPVASSNGLTLNGTLGQPIIGQAAGSTTTLQGGFWNAASPRQYKYFLPVVRR